MAAELEERWNAALTKVTEAEARLEAEPEPAAEPSTDQKEQLLGLGRNLQEAWDHPASPINLKKRILRIVIKEIIVDIDHESGRIEMRIHWQGGVQTPLRAHKNKVEINRNATEESTIELIREMAKVWTDK